MPLPIDEIERPRSLAQLFAATVQLDVRQLELLDRRTHRGFDGFRPPLLTPRVLERVRQLALELHDA